MDTSYGLKNLRIRPFVFIPIGIFVLSAALLSASSFASDNGNALWCEDNCTGPSKLVPRDNWDFMEGYRYKYSDNCTVRWHIRGATFLVPKNCPKLSEERMASDAMKSIAQVKRTTKANNFFEYYDSLENKANTTVSARDYSVEQSRQDARQIWTQACLNAKALKGVPAFKFFEQYPKIQNVHVGRLFANANQTVQGLGGMVNCSEQGQYAADTYTSDIDIRSR